MKNSPTSYFCTLVLLAAVSGSAEAEVIAPPPIITRAQWNALPAVENMMKAHVLRGVVVHHTDTAQSTKNSLQKKIRSLQEFSMRNGVLSGTNRAKPAWGDIPYHFYIDVDGKIAEGRSLFFAGDTNTGYKTDGFIQIVVEGKFETELPKKAQLEALRSLTIWLARRFTIPGDQITAHNDHAPSDCPGKNLKPFLNDLRAAVSGEGAVPTAKRR